jgi:hypothetical protein
VKVVADGVPVTMKLAIKIDDQQFGDVDQLPGGETVSDRGGDRDRVADWSRSPA